MIGDNGLESATESASFSTVINSVCDAECCQMHITGKPYHPPNSLLISKGIQGRLNHYFKQSWVKDHLWISYCTTLHKALFFCVVFCCFKVSYQ